MRIRIDVPCYNRKDITELVLLQLNKTKGPLDEIRIYNDGSTEYDNSWLSTFGTVINYEMPKQDKWRNIHTIRSLAYRDFVEKDFGKFDYLYMTDNDAFHDPNWRSILIDGHNETKMAMSGYISGFIYNNYPPYKQQLEALKFEKYKKLNFTGGGISIFLHIDHVKTVLKRMGPLNMADMWDCMTWAYINNRYALPSNSIVEHFGKGGLHHQTWDQEKAVNPTEYLKNIRPFVLDYLEKRISKNEILQKI